VFVGKNPWHSHGFDAARRVLKKIAADPDRQLIVIDPRRTETAILADYWLPVRPGTDAFLLAAIGSVLVDESLTAERWLIDHVVGVEAATTALGKVPIADFAERCGIAESQIREVARLLANATSVSMLEDLGIEMAPHSTLVSYLHRLVSVLTGNIGNPGGLNPHTSIAELFNYSAAGKEPVDPVTGGRIISGLMSCNEIAKGILSEHPERTRAMFIESANPVHSLADSDAFRRAMRACECTVVIDVAMTETAEQADWVLPAASQYEKAEATFFASGFPNNHFHMRPGILEPLEGTLAEPEIHARLVWASGILDAAEEAGVFDDLRAAAAAGIDAFTTAFTTAAQHHQELSSMGAVVLYETLGRTLPAGSEGAAATWFLTQMTAMQHPEAVRAAGHEGDGPALGNSLWEAIIEGEDGVVFTRHDCSQALELLGTPDGHINLDLPEMFELLSSLPDAPKCYTSDDYPYVLSAGERRAFTANTIIRDPSWRKKDAQGALRLSPADAEALGVDDGGRVRITTPGGVAVAVAEINNTMQEGHVSLPNGHGLAYSPAGGDPEIYGVAPNELTTLDWCDPIAGTPWHKHVPARLEAVSP
jgi:formate dehydrogenase